MSRPDETNLIIRDAQQEELLVIREQRVDAYRQYAEFVPQGHWEALKQAISSDTDTARGVEVIVAEVDGNIAGSVALFPAKTDAYEGYLDALDEPEIRMLAVAPSYRGRGVAQALVSECVRRAKAAGFHAIGLHTGAFMKPAMSLYKKLGFHRVPEHDFVPADDGIVVMAFQLTWE